MPKVLGLVSFRIFPTLMGGQKGVALFYKYLKEHTGVVLAVSSDNEKTKEVQLEKILHANKNIYLNILNLRKLKKLISANDIDVIIAEHSYTGWIAWLLQKMTGKPFIIHSHNIESKRFLEMHKWWWKPYHRYEGWIHRKAQHSFFISREDKHFAIKEFHLNPSQCSVITYGVEKSAIQKNKTESRRQLKLDENKPMLLFNGTLDYKPNYDAVMLLIDQIDPLLLQRTNNYQIVITGNRAPAELLQKMNACENLHYAGYVDDVNDYYGSADLFLNPVLNDTGVKTKLIEAIANNCTAISTVSGSSGLAKELCGDKLIDVADNDWNSFADMVIKHIDGPKTDTPNSFYQYYDWENIAIKTSEKIKEVVNQ